MDKWMIAAVCLVLCVFINRIQSGNIRTFRELYTRQAGKRLPIIPHAQYSVNVTVETCAERCVKEVSFLCKSFDMDNSARNCLLYSVDSGETGVQAISYPNTDHYEGAYSRLFDPTPGHFLYTWINRERYNLTVEQCARLCVLETQFNCRGFNYETFPPRCRLTDATAANSHGVIVQPGTTYYRKVENDLDKFINFGQSSLIQLDVGDTYQQVLRGLGLETCASRCLLEENFHCASFDYVHEGENSQCFLSKYIAANVYGLIKVENPMSYRVNHYERIERELAYFYSTPYAVLPGHNLKTFTFVTPNRCARSCIAEVEFICRSFDYQVRDGTCLLSSSTGSDVGGLYTNLSEEVHHFEMKPILDCGGDYYAAAGDIASPGWPRNYAHHEKCVWNIRVTKNKVVELKFTHFDLGLQSKQPCAENDDRLLLSEPSVNMPTCVAPGLNVITSQGNVVALTFYSNSHTDAPGFRAFYTAVWPCNVHLTQSPGELASPNWPEPYPDQRQCAWRISAPPGLRVKLFMTSFDLDSHVLGHCTEYLDHVQVHDGPNMTSPRIGLYCGTHDSFAILSTGTDLYVVFSSDGDITRPGFHATFIFQLANGTLFKGSDDTNKDNRIFGLLPREELPIDRPQDNDVDGGSVSPADAGPWVAAAVDQFQPCDGQAKYRTIAWVTATLLIVIVLAALLCVVIIWRHYRRQLLHIQQVIRDESLSPESVPLHLSAPIVVYKTKPNNLLGNEVALPSTSSGACGGSTDSAVTYIKYNNDNTKNINLDCASGYSEDAYHDKELLKTCKNIN